MHYSPSVPIFDPTCREGIAQIRADRHVQIDEGLEGVISVDGDKALGEYRARYNPFLMRRERGKEKIANYPLSSFPEQQQMVVLARSPFSTF